jgi:TolA-binding protein
VPWSKLATVAVLGGVMLGGPLLASRWREAEQEHAVLVAAVPSAVAAAEQVEVSASPPREPAVASADRPTSAPPAAVVVAAASPARPLPRATRASAKPAAAAVDRSLRAELRALEASQSALMAGRNAEAQRALDDYAARFPQGELALEAELLQVDVLLAHGERARAHELARALSARGDAARYRERLEALLAPTPGGTAGAQP